MRSPISSAARAARALSLVASLCGACGGSPAAPPAEVELGRATGDPSASEPERVAREDAAEDSPRPPKPEEPTSEEPGYLTLVCDPACDEVSYEGRSLGPSPVVHAPLPPGSRRITVSQGGTGHKIITVILRSGEVNALRVTMGGGGLTATPTLPSPTSSAAAQLPGPATAGPDIGAMRAQLEPKAWAGKASIEELRVLRAIWSYMADRACRDRAAALIKAQSASPP